MPPPTSHLPPPTTGSSASAAGIWLLAARPKTLAAGVAPIAVGTALAAQGGPVSWTAAVACLLCSLLLQIGCNFANDAGDALRGADTPDRLGPARACAGGLVSPRAMLRAAALVLGLALLVGLYLAWLGGWPILVLGLLAIACALAYTLGPVPLAYVGMGDLFVFLFFGVVAVLGSAWVQVAPAGGELAGFGGLVAAAIGFQATAIIVVNNLRDIPTDARTGKRTLAVRLGPEATRRYYLALHLAAGTALWTAGLLGGPAARHLQFPACLAFTGGVGCAIGVRVSDGAALNPWLGRTASLELATAAATVAALLLA